jgi:PadR family transcriptional regulator, regulatory protein AphA
VTNSPSTTSQAILGLLSLRSWSTYELAKQAQRSLEWFWPRAERKLYDEPKRLVAAGLASADREMTGARPRTVYSVTRKGRSALRRWLGEPPAPPSLEFEGMVKVFFADGGTLEQLRANLGAIASTADERCARLWRNVDEALDPEAGFAYRQHLSSLGVRFHLQHEQLVADWARWALQQTEGWTSTTDPGAWDHLRALDGLRVPPAAS